jgi:hypothetical protein
MVCVSLSVIRYKNNPLHLQCIGIRGQTSGGGGREGEREEKKEGGVQVYLLVGSNCTRTAIASTRVFTNAALTAII